MVLPGTSRQVDRIFLNSWFICLGVAWKRLFTLHQVTMLRQHGRWLEDQHRTIERLAAAHACSLN
jgi:hypothetical protein